MTARIATVADAANIASLWADILPALTSYYPEKVNENYTVAQVEAEFSVKGQRLYISETPEVGPTPTPVMVPRGYFLTRDEMLRVPIEFEGVFYDEDIYEPAERLVVWVTQAGQTPKEYTETLLDLFKVWFDAAIARGTPYLWGIVPGNSPSKNFAFLDTAWKLEHVADPRSGWVTFYELDPAAGRARLDGIAVP